jgi:CMP-N,N'-diacetyllegionaminic acid synthase
MLKKLVAVIPVRKGSQRVKNKNFRNFNNKNLLEHKIATLKRIKEIDQIIVNTDSSEGIKIAKKYKVNYKLREKYFASSSCTNSEFWAHIAETTVAKYILFVDCTNPLVKKDTYSKAIKKFMNYQNRYDSLNTVTEVKEFLYLNKKPINFNPNKSPNSQNLPDIVKLNFAITIISRELMFKKKSLIGYKPLFYKLDEIEGLDIDTIIDFEFAEYLHKKLF